LDKAELSSRIGHMAVLHHSDLKSWATNAEEKAIEYFDTFAEAETQFLNPAFRHITMKKATQSQRWPYAR
jgi:cytochrome P450